MITKQPANIWLAAFCLTMLILNACYQTMSLQCHYSSDCESTEYCRAGQCVPASNQPVKPKAKQQQHTEYDDVFEGNSSIDTSAAPTPPCPEGRLPKPGDIVINEFLVNVPLGAAGDANGDGIRHPHDDEFVEIINVSGYQLDLSSVKIQNATSTKHTFPRFCLDDGHAVVVFGGIESGATPPTGPGFHAMISLSRFMFNNEQGTIIVRGADNAKLLAIDYDRSPPQALTLSPQLHGTRFVPHNSLVAGALFSPGTCADSQSIIDGCSIADEADADDVDGGSSPVDD